MDILRFITAGNVDDGKSTLIGRLLFDTNSVSSDILQKITAIDTVNFAHLTDGLRTERTEGITIDVAYKYFTTTDRKYIITDAPGHFQYTKNLVTGASEVDVIVILIDSKSGITEQTKRHAIVASFLKIRQIIVAINKMDLVDYSEKTYEDIVCDFEKIATILQLPSIKYIPLSALLGDNVLDKSENMKWYKGDSLLQHLEKCKPFNPESLKFRFVVQFVIYDGIKQLCFGKILSGKLLKGESVRVNSSEFTLMVEDIYCGYSDCVKAEAGQNICLHFTGMQNIKRGDLISGISDFPKICYSFFATLCWLDDSELKMDKEYYLRINSTLTLCKVARIISKINTDTFEKNTDNKRVSSNEIAKVIIDTKSLIYYDSFSEIQFCGRGVIIDKETNYTSGAFTID